MAKKKRIVIALGGNALGNTLPEQMVAVKVTAKAIVDLIEEGCEVIVSHGNGPQVGMINNAMTHFHQVYLLPFRFALQWSGISVTICRTLCVRDFYNRGIHDIPVATMITQVRVDESDPAFLNPTKPIGQFMSLEDAQKAEIEYGYIVKEDSGRGYRRVVASPKPVEIIEIGAIHSC